MSANTIKKGSHIAFPVIRNVNSVLHKAVCGRFEASKYMKGERQTGLKYFNIVTLKLVLQMNLTSKLEDSEYIFIGVADK